MLRDNRCQDHLPQHLAIHHFFAGSFSSETYGPSHKKCRSNPMRKRGRKAQNTLQRQGPRLRGLVVLHKSVRFPPGLSRRDHNWLATKASKMSRSPSGLSRREHDLQATCANSIVAPAGTGPTESRKCSGKVFPSVLV